MRKDWEYKKLGEIAENKLSYGSGASAIPFDNKTRYIRITDIDDFGNLKESIVSPNVVEDKYLLSDGDILFARSGATVGKTFLYKERYGECIYAGYLIRLVPNQQMVLPEYVYCYTQSHYYKSFVESNKKVVAQPNINAQQYAALQIPLPPKSTQEAIVAELDKLNEMIRLKKQQLEDYDQLAQSIFYEMFGNPVENEKGWEVKKLGEICDVRDGTHDSPKYVEHSDFILITSKNIENNRLSFENVNYISEEDFIRINIRSKVDDGDIIMPMIGTIGNPIIIKLDSEINFAIKNVALVKFYSTSSVINYYLQNLMKSTSFENDITRLHKGGTQKFIALGTIRNFRIPLPPLPLQQQFAARIEAIEQQKQQVKDTIKDLETLLASRMQYWFD